jgi:hypothetical protein
LVVLQDQQAALETQQRLPITAVAVAVLQKQHQIILHTPEAQAHRA